jgi:membrane protein YqaA with SNARE-associated domain
MPIMDQPEQATEQKPEVKPASPLHAADAERPPVPWWAYHRRMYDWVLGFAGHRYSTTALFTLSFTESSVFPIPPDVLLGPMCLGNRSRAFWYAFICTVASVLGGVVGYLIGIGGMELIGNRILDIYDPDRSTWGRIQDWYAAWGFLGIVAAAITPIPYKVFTIASGAFEFNFISFIVASVVGRGFRFFVIAGLMWQFGPPILKFIDRYFNLVCLVFMVLLIGGFVLLRYIGD